MKLGVIMGAALRIAAALAVVASLGGCASTSSLLSWGDDDDKKAKKDIPASELFKKADKLLDEGEFTKAAEKFEEVDKLYPYAPEARRAIIMAAYAYYKAGKLPETVTTARRYLTLHPGTKEAALAQHLIASSYFERINEPNRDQTDTKRALAELQTLVRRYPNSSYAPKARKRIKIAQDLLAASEMTVGRYYLEKSNYLAAINRFRTVVEKYQSTAHVEEALSRLTEAYMALGIKSEAQTAAAILGHNFPESKWYKDAYVLLKTDGLEPREDSGSWISRSWKKAVRSVSEASPI